MKIIINNRLGHRTFVVPVAIFVLMIMHNSSGMLHPAFGTDAHKKRAMMAPLQLIREARANVKAEEMTLKTLSLDEIKTQAKSEPVVLVQTADGFINIERWKIEQMILLSQHLIDKKNQEESIDASKIIGSFPLQLVSHAYDALAYGKFDAYYNDLEQEYKKSLTDKKLGEGRLCLLRAASEKVGAKDLFALFTARMLPKDSQRMIISESIIVEPVCRYLKEELLKRAKKVGQHIPFGKILNTFALTADNSKCLMGGAEGELTLFDLKSRQRTIFNRVPVRSPFTHSIIFNKGGDRAISCHSLKLGGAISLLWDVSTRTLVSRNIAGYRDIIGFSPDGKQFITAKEDTLYLYDSSNGKLIKNLAGHTEEVASFSWHPMGDHIVSSAKGEVLLWDVAKGVSKNIAALPRARILFSPQTGRKMLCATEEKIVMFEFESFDNVHQLYEHSFKGTGTITTTNFSDDEEQYAVILKRKANVVTANAQSDQFSPIKEYSLDALSSGHYQEKFSPDGLSFVVVNRSDDPSLAGDLLFFDRQTGREIVHFKDNFGGDESRGLYFDEKGNQLFVNNGSGINIWQLPDAHDLGIIEVIRDKLNIAQSLLLYELYLAKLKGSSFETPFKKEVFKTLPGDVQKIVTECLLSTRESIAENIELSSLSLALSGSENITEQSEGLLFCLGRYLKSWGW